jgi:hypothetical protein
MIEPDVLTATGFAHLIHLSDDRAVFEHALLSEPRIEHGYCVDDVARALVVLCREPALDVVLGRLLERCLAFTAAAVDVDGACHNRMDVSGVWTDVPDTKDWWGRAIWGLGLVATHGPDAHTRSTALVAFERAVGRRSAAPRAMAFAALGAGEVLLADPDHAHARALLRDSVASIGPARPDPSWPWPEDRLAYGNGAIAEALLIAGAALPDDAALSSGLILLDFLLRTETRDDHLSPTPVGGRALGENSPGFDQQPIEAAALADACARAYTITGDDRWRQGVELAWSWFVGNNDNGTFMVDLETGAGFDGLHRVGRNLNQGAESTIAAISTRQNASRLGLTT